MTTYTYFNVDYPLAIGDTFAQGINDTGQIVGWYGGGGFLYSGGTYTTLNDPSVTGTHTFAYGINDASQIVGYYGGGDNGGYHGFLYSGGVYTNIDNPSTSNNTYPQEWK